MKDKEKIKNDDMDVSGRKERIWSIGLINITIKIKDQEVCIYGLQYEIQLLKHQLENFESLQREKCCECERKSVVEFADAEFKLMELKEKIERLIK